MAEDTSAGRGGAPVRVGLIGVGQFGTSLLASARRLPELDVAVLCERRPERAADAWRSVFGDLDRLARCSSRNEALRALAAGRSALIDEGALMADLPIDVVVEATGDPEAGAANAYAALAHGKHVVLVTKEADITVGPLLAHEAGRAGLVCTPVDGDQPSLLIRLIHWARRLGFEITAAGKASEYDFVFDPGGETVSVAGRTVGTSGFARLWRLHRGDVSAALAERSLALRALPQRTVPDFCEMGIVVNASGLRPDEPGFHAPVMRPLEGADVFSPRAHGGLLQSTGAIDVFNCLRRLDEASFAGGVFVVVACDHRPTWELLREKGHIVSADGAHAMLYHPQHLLGVEAVTSIMRAARTGRPTPGMDVRPRCDLVARTSQPLAKETRLVLGARHSIDGLDPLLLDAAPVHPDSPLPYYLAAGARLVCDVPPGAVLTAEMVAPPADSALWRLRALQDALFFA